MAHEAISRNNYLDKDVPAQANIWSIETEAKVIRTKQWTRERHFAAGKNCQETSAKTLMRVHLQLALQRCWIETRIISRDTNIYLILLHGSRMTKYECLLRSFIFRKYYSTRL